MNPTKIVLDSAQYGYNFDNMLFQHNVWDWQRETKYRIAKIRFDIREVASRKSPMSR